MASSMVGASGFGATGKPKKIGNTGYQSVTSQQFTPEQMELFTQMFGQVGPDSYLSKLAGGDQSAFGELEAPALQQFSELQGGLASRFSGMGGVGANRTSGAQNAQTSAASNFSQQLQAQRLGIRQNAMRDLQSMSSELLGQRPYSEHILEPKQKEPSFWEKLLGSIGGAGAQLGGSYATKKLGIYG